MEQGSRRIVQEEGGLPITIGLKRTNPFVQTGCQYIDPTCITKRDKDCGWMGLVYAIKYNTCRQELDPGIKEYLEKPGGIKTPHYIGMTACSLHSRMQSHLAGQQRGTSTNNPLVRHDSERSNGVIKKHTLLLLSTKNRHSWLWLWRSGRHIINVSQFVT